MSNDKIERKLVTILAADAVGYSRLVGADEEGALATLKACREIIDPLIERYGGRIFGSAGDSVIAEFGSPVEAVRCATEIQLSIDAMGSDTPPEQRMRFRIGVNLGDVVVDGEDLKGDGVNIAARLEALAPPGGICISEAVQSQVQNRLGLEFFDLGEHKVKNIVQAIRAFRVPIESEEQTTSPYRGLDAFEFEHADMFFGRAAAIAAAKSRLESQAEKGTAFLLIYGISGTGKSSLLRAGLLPALVSSQVDDGVELWRYCQTRPADGADPIDALMSSLTEESALPELGHDQSPMLTAAELAENPGAAAQRVRAALADAAKRAGTQANLARLVIAIDQMEELFTSESIGPAMREQYVALLSSLVKSGHTWIACAMRADFYHRCGEVPGFSELKDGLGSYELLPPDGPEIAQMIREPARATGVKFESNATAGNLADVLQQAAVSNPGSLPLLQFVLDSLFEAGKDKRQITFSAYRALGGLEGAISRRADEIVDGLPKSIQETLPLLLNALTTVREQDSAATARPTRRSEVSTKPEADELINAMLASRLLVSSEDSQGRPVLRLAHEALLTSWPRARDIIAANREFLATRARVSADANHWQSEDRKPDLLLPSGSRLAEAEEMIGNHRDNLQPEIVEFVEQSVAARDKKLHEEREAERKRNQAEAEHARREADSARRLASRTRIAAVITLCLAILAGIGAYVGFRGQSEAVHHATIAENAANEARSAQHEAERLAGVALHARDDAQRTQSLFLADLALEQIASGDPSLGALLALEALPETPANPERPLVAEAQRALQAAMNASHPVALLRHGDRVLTADFSPDGRSVVTASWDGTAGVWNAEDGKQLLVLAGHDGPLKTATFGPDGEVIVTLALDRSARIWNVATGKQLAVLETGSIDVRTALVSPKGDRILVATFNEGPLLWESSTGKRIKLQDVPGTYRTLSADFHQDGDRFLTSHEDSTVRIWNSDDGKLLSEYRGNGEPLDYAIFGPGKGQVLAGSVSGSGFLWNEDRRIALAVPAGTQGAAFTLDGRWAATSAVDGSARVWNAKTGRLRHILGLETDKRVGAVLYRTQDPHVSFSPDGRLVATTALDGLVRVWNVDNGSLYATLRGHTGAIDHVAFNADGQLLATASHDGTARIWNLNTLMMLPHQQQPTFVAYSPNGKHLFTSSIVSPAADIWDAGSGKHIASLDSQTGTIPKGSFSPDGTIVATASTDGTVGLWNAETGAAIRRLSSQGRPLTTVRFNRNGDRIVAATSHGTALIWDARSAELVAEIGADGASFAEALISPDGTSVLTVLKDNSARLWTMDGSPELDLVGHSAPISAAGFSGHDNLIATGSTDGTAYIWDQNGNIVSELSGHQGAIRHVSFSPDGDRVVTASEDGTARIWSAMTGQEIVRLNMGTEPVIKAVFNRDGERILASTADGQSWLWRLDDHGLIGSWQSHGPSASSAVFSPDESHIAIISGDTNVRIVPNFVDTQAIIDHAKATIKRRLSQCEREQYFLVPPSDGASCQ